LWQHEGFGLARRGVALSIELPRGLTDGAAVAQVASTLAAIQRSDDVTGPGNRGGSSRGAAVRAGRARVALRPLRGDRTPRR